VRIAIVGTGIAGLTVAHLLHGEHDLAVFEAEDWIGGHTHTVEVETAGGRRAVDTGFIVFNRRNYPAFTRLLERLGVPSRPSTMSFSVRVEGSGHEYNATSLGRFFVQRLSLFRRDPWRILADIVRFQRASRQLLAGDDPDLTLGDYLRRGRFSTAFTDRFLVPMGAAIWSADPAAMERFPAQSFARFFHHHNFLGLTDRPRWRTVVGGSARYVEALVRPFRDRLRTGTRVQSVRRHPDRVEVRSDGATERFDQVVLATHSDQALALLADPSPLEREVLSALPYQGNDVVLHTDTRLLPRSRRAWGGWNYTIPEEPRGRVTVTYDMNILQGLDGPDELLVTLNQAERVGPERVLGRFRYHHPVFTPAGLRAQRRHEELNGAGPRTWFCGAYWGYGFHEDGVQSGLAVARHFGQDL
jgi:predicted NAD/FAD-binding protein